MIRKILILSFVLLVLSFSLCYAASITKESQSDFSVLGSLHENTTASTQPGYVILEPAGGASLWTANGTAICTESAQDQYEPEITSDGNGGAIIIWQDFRDGNSDIYTQKINSSGEPQWSLDGRVVCSEGNIQRDYEIISDEAGGAIITWEDNQTDPDFDIYALRIDSSGSAPTGWTSNGTAICTQSSYQYDPQLASDGNGGAIITWQDRRLGNYDIYAQRVDSSGIPQWITNGVTICADSSSQMPPQIVADGSGGAIITWRDNRLGNYDIYAQRINSSGEVQWTTDGVTVCAVDYSQDYPEIASDGNGGAIITWVDYRNNSHDDIYAQRINGSGEAEWTANGKAVCNADQDQQYHQIISDGSGGAIIAWADYRNNNDNDVYAQKINSDGFPQWTIDGVAISAVYTDQEDPYLVSDGNGGAIITWYGYDYQTFNNYDVFAQKVDSDGIPQWTTNGVIISSGDEYQDYPKIAADGSGGAIIAWQDGRNTFNADIYTQRINDGYSSSGRYTTEKIENTDSQFEGWTTLAWTGSGTIAAEVRTATSYAGLDSASWTSVTNGGDIPNRDDLNFTWIQVRTSLAAGVFNLTSSSLDTLTMYSATDDGSPTITNVTFDGVAVSSGDNIPAAPLIKATITDPASSGIDPNNIFINIHGGDFSPDSFASGVMTFQVPAISAFSTDITHTVSIRASDYANNISTWSATSLRVLEGAKATNVVAGPSPFNPLAESTYLTYNLPENTRVTIYIFTLTGEPIFKQVIIPPDEGAKAGPNSVPWNGRNQSGGVVANGGYLYKIIANGKVTGSGKIMIIR
jgi:hypothetical protein